MWQNIQMHIKGKWRRHSDAAQAAFVMHCSGVRSQEKKTTRYQEQEEQRVAAYQEQIKDIPPEKIAYVDECGIDTYLYREYGYASRGQQVFGRISGRRYQRCGIVAAKMGDQIIAPFQYSGTKDTPADEEVRFAMSLARPWKLTLYWMRSTF